MATETPDVHADPTKDHLSAQASDEAIEAANKADEKIQDEHFNVTQVAVDDSGETEAVADSVLAPSEFQDERRD